MGKAADRRSWTYDDAFLPSFTQETALADRCQQVDDAHGDVLRIGFQDKAAAGVNRRQLVERNVVIG